MTPQIHTLIRHLAPDLDVPAHTVLTAVLRAAGANHPATLLGAGAGTLVFAAGLGSVPTGRCVLSLTLAGLRIDFPVRIAAEPASGTFRAAVDGVPLILRRRVTMNPMIAAALRVAA